MLSDRFARFARHRPPRRHGAFRRASPGHPSAGAPALALLAMVLLALPLGAQQGAIAGQVIDAQSLEPLQGVQVFVSGTDLGALSDQDGRYRITNVPTGTVQVQARLIGYRQVTESVAVTAGQVAALDIQLPVSAVQLEDVVVNVVTGLERRKRQLGANVGEIDVARVNKGQVTDFSDLLAGRSEGVILQDVSGTTGTSQKIRIRGANSLSLSNEPLVFVDGVQVTNDQALDLDVAVLSTGGQDPSRLNDINPEDIESIEVVKGPAASALYGAVGANGVLLIRTKRGSAGRTNWHFYAEGGVLNDETDYPGNFAAAQVVGDPDAPLFTENGFNTADFAPCPNHAAATGQCTQDVTTSFNTLLDPRTSPFSTGERQTYGLNVSGGSDVVTYFVSGELEQEEGVIFFNEEDKASVRTNLDAGLLDNLSASISLGYVNRDLALNSNDNSIFSPLINGLAGAAGFVPGEADNGGPNRQNYRFDRNLTDHQEASIWNQQIDRFTGSLNVTWQPLRFLSAQGTFGLDLLNNFDTQTVQPGVDDLAAILFNGQRTASRNNRWNWTANGSVTASFDLTDRITSVSTAGGSFQEELINGVSCFGSGLVRGTGTCTSTSSLFAVDEDFLNVVTVGGFFQQEFAFADRLFLTGSVRVDDNSTFGGNAPIEAYPSASLSYVISEEEWFPDGDFLTELRLRGAYGVAGTRPAFRDAVTLFAPVTVTVDGADVPAVTLNETGNELLEPERSTEIEAGFDAALLGDRLGLEFTYYDRDSQDALIQRQIPPSFGLTASLFENLGSIRNRGTELSLRASALEKRDVRADFLVQWTTLDNEIQELGEGVEPIVINRGEQRHEEGFPAGAFFEEPFSFDDANGDGLLSIDEVMLTNEESCADAPEACFIDESIPTWTISLTADIELFQFLRFSSLVDARGGHSQLNGTERFRCDQFSVPGHGCPATGDPNASLEDQAAFIASRFLGSRRGFIEEADFLKWREVSVEISPPPALARKHRLLERTSLTVSGRNLATITDYSGLDPEINETGGSSNFTQGDTFTQPPIQIFTARLDIRF